MTKLILQPAAGKEPQKNFARTMASPVDFNKLEREGYVDKQLMSQIRAVHPDGKARVWAATPGPVNLRAWERMEAGDIVLFYAGGKFSWSYRLSLRPTERYPELARQLWAPDPQSGQAFECLFFLDDPRAEDIPWDDVWTMAPHGPRGMLRKVTVLPEAESAPIIERFSLQRGSNDGLNENGSSPKGLITVRTISQIRAAVATFNAQADESARSMLTQTSYWVFDPMINAFGPSKFVGLQEISLARYEAAKADAASAGSLGGFDGHASKLAIERATKLTFEPSVPLSENLGEWATELLDDTVFDGVDRAKWAFVTIPAPSSSKNATRARPKAGASADQALQDALDAALNAANFPSGASEDDARERVLADIVRRRGQPKFRRMLLAAYGYRCAVTGCDVEAAIEAAHLIAYNGDATNHPTNGLPLRGDIHTLFDLGLLWIDGDSLTVALDPSIRTTHYGMYHGRAIALPEDAVLYPNRDALRRRLPKKPS